MTKDNGSLSEGVVDPRHPAAPGLPQVTAPFEWRDHRWGAGLVCRALDDVRHVFTTRQLRLTTEDDWRVLAETVDVPAGRVLRLKQVHGAGVVRAEASTGQPTAPPEGDVLISQDPSVALSVRVADCAPILLADRRTGAVAAVHAGWKGTAARAAVAAVEAMAHAFGTSADHLVVAIGPTIGSCCYEVGTELVDAFAEQGHARHLIDRWFIAVPPRRGDRSRPPLRLDIPGANRDQLILAGVPEEQIHVAGLCTAMHLDVFTSFRVEREKAGRLAAVIRAAG